MKVWNNFFLGQHIIKALLFMLAKLFFSFLLKLLLKNYILLLP
jgi:hypothetical protein